MWPDKSVGERVHKDFVPLLIDVDEDEETPALYDVTAMPTLVITDSEGAELAKSVGAPFSDAEGAIQWIDDTVKALDELPKLLAAFDESKHTDVEAGGKLAEVYVKLGSTEKALEVYENMILGMNPDDKRIPDLKLKCIDILMEAWELEKAGGMIDELLGSLPKDDSRCADLRMKKAQVTFYNGEYEAARKEFTALYDEFVKAKDERGMEAAFMIAQSWFAEEENGKAREIMLDALKHWPEAERAIEARVWAAWAANAAGETETAVKELKAVIEAGPEDHQWVGIAKDLLAEMEGEGENG